LAFLTVALFLPSTAWGESVLTEAEVLRIARAQMPEMGVAEASESLAESRQKTSTPLVNPTLQLRHEGLENGNFEEEIGAQFTLPTPAIGAQRSLAASASSWLRVDAVSVRRSALLEALTIYYDWHAAVAQEQILERAVRNLAEATRVLGARASAGVASDYEERRLSLATQMAQSDVARAAGMNQALRKQLAARLSLGAEVKTPAAELSLVPLPNEEILLRQALGENDLLERADLALSQARKAHDRASLGWIPIVALAAGLRRVHTPQDLVGYSLGLNVAVPIFNHGQMQLAEAKSQRALSQARIFALSAQIRADVQSQYAVYQAALSDLTQFDESTNESLELLLRAARSGYREGERSIIELLDAQQIQTDIALRRVALVLRAKRAEATLRSLTGEFE
jgi:cobalt-zinc-cadmium efflux system outer membrane protein